MKITIESTTQIVQLDVSAGKQRVILNCRVWEGETKSGIKVSALIPRIAALKGQDLQQFERELEEQEAPSADVRAFPLRMII